MLAGRTQGAFNRPYTYERADGTTRQWLGELRLTSEFDGDLNFLIGAFYLDFNRKVDFYQINNGFDATALFIDQVLGGDARTPFFRQPSPTSDLVSYAGFGELYWDASEDVRLTGGLRFTRDEKEQSSRATLLTGLTPFNFNSLEEDATTGRLVAEWSPDLAAMGLPGEGLFYASYARGYKGGGFNPAAQGGVEIPRQFEPEFVNAFELGAKLTPQRGLIVNLTGFYYDYEGLQVSRIVNRTAIADNIDAEIYGAEIEAFGRIDENWSFDLTASYLHTEIGDAAIIDPRDPTGGRAGFIAVKDVVTGANCVATLAQLAGPLGGVPFGDCDALSLTDGNPVSISGNEIAQAPEFIFFAGLSYETEILSQFSLRGRVDYSWRSDFWGRIFNRDPIDRIDSYQIVNAQLEFADAEDAWFVRAEGTNLFDEDAVTGLFVADATSGNPTNLFLLPARQINLRVGARF